MLAVRGSARHRLEHASDRDHQPIREAVGVSGARGCTDDPIGPGAGGRQDEWRRDLQDHSARCRRRRSERSRDAMALGGPARRRGLAPSADPCPQLRPAREPAVRRRLRTARPRRRRRHVRRRCRRPWGPPRGASCAWCRTRRRRPVYRRSRRNRRVDDRRRLLAPLRARPRARRQRHRIRAHRRIGSRRRRPARLHRATTAACGPSDAASTARRSHARRSHGRPPTRKGHARASQADT
jgi:hypothetical protein